MAGPEPTLRLTFGHGIPQLREKDIRHVSVIVLTGMHERLFLLSADLSERVQYRRRFHEIRPSAEQPARIFMTILFETS